MKKITYLLFVLLFAACSEAPKKKVQLESVGSGEEESSTENQVKAKDYFYYVDGDFAPHEAEVQLRVKGEAVTGWSRFDMGDFKAFVFITGTKKDDEFQLRLKGLDGVQGRHATWSETWYMQPDGALVVKGDAAWLGRNARYEPTTKDKLKFGTFFKTTVSNLRLRAEPNLNSRVVTSLPENTAVISLEEKSSHTTQVELRDKLYNEHWFLVREDKSRSAGWAYGAALTEIDWDVFFNAVEDNSWQEGKYCYRQSTSTGDQDGFCSGELFVIVDAQGDVTGWAISYDEIVNQRGYSEVVCIGYSRIRGTTDGDILKVRLIDIPSAGEQKWRRDYHALEPIGQNWMETYRVDRVERPMDAISWREISRSDIRIPNRDLSYGKKEVVSYSGAGPRYNVNPPKRTNNQASSRPNNTRNTSSNEGTFIIDGDTYKVTDLTLRGQDVSAILYSSAIMNVKYVNKDGREVIQFGYMPQATVYGKLSCRVEVGSSSMKRAKVTLYPLDPRLVGKKYEFFMLKNGVLYEIISGEPLWPVVRAF